MERTLMVETATTAIKELIKLLQIDEPLWTKSFAAAANGRYTLHRDSYEKVFPIKDNHLRSASSAARFESSKHSGIIAMSPAYIVDSFLDSVCL